MKKKFGRNEPCPCGSGKKFKKCCERLMIAGRFRAEKIDNQSSSQIQKTVGMTSLFKTRLAGTPKKPTEVDGFPQSTLLNKITPKGNVKGAPEVSSREQISSH